MRVKSPAASTPAPLTEPPPMALDPNLDLDLDDREAAILDDRDFMKAFVDDGEDRDAALRTPVIGNAVVRGAHERASPALRGTQRPHVALAMQFVVPQAFERADGRVE